jgi:N-glycosidase YbiA
MIDRFAGKYWFLSNHHPCKVFLDEVEYPSVEHAYMSAKTLSLAEREIIRTCGDAVVAKKLGKHVTLREDWNEIKLQVMTYLLMQKFSHTEFAKLLKDTSPHELVEGNWWGDVFWGICNGQGENWLGKILMQIRDELNG